MVADSGNHRLQMWDPNTGSYISSVGRRQDDILNEGIPLETPTLVRMSTDAATGHVGVLVADAGSAEGDRDAEADECESDHSDGEQAEMPMPMGFKLVDNNSTPRQEAESVGRHVRVRLVRTEGSFEARNTPLCAWSNAKQQGNRLQPWLW